MRSLRIQRRCVRLAQVRAVRARHQSPLLLRGGGGRLHLRLDAYHHLRQAVQGLARLRQHLQTDRRQGRHQVRLHLRLRPAQVRSFTVDTGSLRLTSSFSPHRRTQLQLRVVAADIAT